MKNLVNYIISAIFITALITSCQSPEKKVEDAQKDLNQAKEDLNKKQADSVNEYQTMKADWAKQINDNQRKIEELKEEKIEKKTSVEQDYNNKIADLQKENNDLQSKMSNYKYSSTDTKWQEFKEGINRDLKKLESDIKYVKNKIQNKKEEKDK